MKKEQLLLEKLKQMPVHAYGAPFWAWNADLKEEELCSQIEKMKKEHYGGFFIHSREGLETPYLSEEWMGCVSAALEKGREEGLEAWIYDDDKWPSGMSGGMVTAADPELRAVGLTMHMENGHPVYNVEKTGPDEWYNGYCAADNLNPDSVRKFLEITHEKYEKTVGGELNKYVTGFFTDEPNICDFFCHFSEGSVWLPWSDGFEQFFEERRGYDIREKLDGLFFQTEGCEKVRHDYCLTIVERFGESYFKQIHDWLAERNLKLAGHLIFENDMGYAARTSGAIMPFYEYFDIPGIDILGEQDQEFLTVKQCTSVANQLGKEYTVSEIYGCTKWEFGFEGQKWEADWQYILGIGRRCQHLHLYSMRGQRKRDYPPVFSYQTPLWEQSHILEDYYARLHVCTHHGTPVRDVLVLHPMSSVWIESFCSPEEDLSEMEGNMGWTDENFRKNNAFGQEFAGFLEGMFGSHCDMDLGDEILMQKYGRAENGKICVGQAEYKCIVIPKVTNIFRRTLELISEFLRQGGTVIWTGAAPAFVDGERSSLAEKIYGAPGVMRVADYRAALDQTVRCVRSISVTDEKGLEDTDLLIMQRRCREGLLVICVNHDRERAHRAMFRSNTSGRILAMDLLRDSSAELTGEITEDGKKMLFMDTLEPCGSRVYLICADEPVREAKQQFAYRHPHETEKVWKPLQGEGTIHRSHPNVLILDRCRYRTDIRGKWSEEMEVWQAQREIRSQFGMRQIYYNGGVQRYEWIHEQSEKKQGLLQLCFEVEVDEIPQGDVWIGIENAEQYSMLVNNIEYRTEGAEQYYLDRTIRMVKAGNIRQGINQIVLNCSYRHDSELEAIYVLGDFEVDQSRKIRREQGTLLPGDWCLQGYKHYAGTIVYSYCVKAAEGELDNRKIVLRLGRQNTGMTAVKVNGQDAGFAFGKTGGELEITGYLKEGENKISIEVTVPPRNVFGPFHQANETCIRSAWDDFCTEGDLYDPDYKTVPYGLMEKPILVEIQ